jgi:hypothetical protein
MGTKAAIPKNLFWVRVPVKVVSLARKPSKIEELCQDQSCLFRRQDYKNEETTTKICPGFESQ